MGLLQSLLEGNLHHLDGGKEIPQTHWAAVGALREYVGGGPTEETEFAASHLLLLLPLVLLGLVSLLGLLGAFPLQVAQLPAPEAGRVGQGGVLLLNPRRLLLELRAAGDFVASGVAVEAVHGAGCGCGCGCGCGFGCG
jgi:hypothetical protein